MCLNSVLYNKQCITHHLSLILKLIYGVFQKAVGVGLLSSQKLLHSRKSAFDKFGAVKPPQFIRKLNIEGVTWTENWTLGVTLITVKMRNLTTKVKKILRHCICSLCCIYLISCSFCSKAKLISFCNVFWKKYCCIAEFVILFAIVLSVMLSITVTDWSSYRSLGDWQHQSS